MANTTSFEKEGDRRGGGELISEYASAYGRKLKFINELNLRPCTDVHFEINFPPFRFYFTEWLNSFID